MEAIKKVITFLGVVLAFPALAAASLGDTVNMGLNYSTVVGWGTRELRETIMLVVNVLMGFLGILAIIGIVYGGFKMMVAGGNEEEVATGKKAMVAGVVGLFIVIAAYAIAAFVVQSLVNATT